MLPALDETRIDRVIQFALAAAVREDERRDRQLGPIHLVKHVYLADLAHAEEHGGETFTGAAWRFHHFGPWAAEVYRRIEPAAEAIGAEQRRFPSRYDTDVVRYSVEDEGLLDRLERGLPWEVVSAVRRAVREHGADTESLLHQVYATAPMLQSPPPRYDEVFLEGIRQLDELAGPPPPEGEAEAVFSDDIWKSRTRGGRNGS